MSAREPVEASEDGVLVRLKVVPGGSRNAFLGLHGDRIRIKVAAPPEGGKANKAVCALIAGALGIPPRDVEVTQGTSSPRKTVRVRGIDASHVARALGIPMR